MKTLYDKNGVTLHAGDTVRIIGAWPSSVPYSVVQKEATVISCGRARLKLRVENDTEPCRFAPPDVVVWVGSARGVPPRGHIEASCPHPGRYHLTRDEMAIVEPHPAARTCFAREQGTIILTFGDTMSAAEVGPAVLKALNDLPDPRKPYRVVWDNGHATGALPGRFGSANEAERAARAWKREMVSVETTAHGRREARRDYTWDVVHD